MVKTFRDKFMEKYKLDKKNSYDINDISKITKLKKSILQKVYNRGYSAASTNSQSVRSKSGEKRDGGFSKSNRMTPEQWGYGRLFGFVMMNPKQVGNDKPDNDLYLLLENT
jgi:hypothetical protein